MGIGRSTFYDMPDARARDLTIVAEMKTICDEFEAYGYRRVDAELRHRGIVVNAKKIRRLMREHALNPWPLAARAQQPKKVPGLCFVTFDPDSLPSRSTRLTRSSRACAI
jgi:transposase InsO family protein